MPEALLTVDEAAQRLKMHPDTLRRHLRRGEIRAVKRGPRLWRIPESALEAPNIESRGQAITLSPSPFSIDGIGHDGITQVEKANLETLFVAPTPEEIATRLKAWERFGGDTERGTERNADAPELDLSGDRGEVYGYTERENAQI